MNGFSKVCASCDCWEPQPSAAEPGSQEGLCRRHAPAAAPAGPGLARAAWPCTLDRDWCGEWQPRLSPDGPPLDEETDRQLRNSSAAQAILTLSPETREELLQTILSEEERASDSPPGDFYERVQEYFARRREDGSE